MAKHLLFFVVFCFPWLLICCFCSLLRFVFVVVCCSFCMVLSVVFRFFVFVVFGCVVSSLLFCSCCVLLFCCCLSFSVGFSMCIFEFIVAAFVFVVLLPFFICSLV